MALPRFPPGSRRSLLVTLAAGTALAGSRALAADKEGKPDEKKDEEEVTPGEDLMREHGVLNRVLLIYDEGARRLRGKDEPPLEVLGAAAGLVEKFIEGYHEKLEEEQVFPRLEKAGKLVELCRTLRAQHAAGRKVTEHIRALAANKALAPSSRESLAAALGAFTRMYRPHEAREDTVLFPAFADSMPRKEYEALGEKFEAAEKQHVGEKGFERAVDEVAELEKRLGIYELAQFTPK